MGCVRFARLTDIPVCSETEALKPYMVLSVNRSDRWKKINQTIF